MLGELIGAGLSLLGMNKQNDANAKAALRQEKLQKEFAQSGIQWKVADAEKAGIHPLYAMGANTVSYQPQSIGGADYSALGNAGQNIGRAIDATRSNPVRGAAALITKAQIEGLNLDNDLKRVQINSALGLARQAGTGPGLPSAGTVPSAVGMPGQGDTPQVDPSMIDINDPRLKIQKTISPTMPGTNKSAEYGAAPEVAFYKTTTGWAPQIPQALSEPFEQDWPSFYQWWYRNKFAPHSSNTRFNPPKHVPLRRGHKWEYYPMAGEYRQVPRFQTRPGM